MGSSALFSIIMSVFFIMKPFYLMPLCYFIKILIHISYFAKAEGSYITTSESGTAGLFHNDNELI